MKGEFRRHIIAVQSRFCLYSHLSASESGRCVLPRALPSPPGGPAAVGVHALSTASQKETDSIWNRTFHGMPLRQVGPVSITETARGSALVRTILLTVAYSRQAFRLGDTMA
jgi:hypothetical protein